VVKSAASRPKLIFTHSVRGIKMATADDAKRAAGIAACEFVESGMRLGLGTGSTVSHTVIELGRLIAEDGLDVVGVPTSIATADLAAEVGVPLLDWSEVDALDLIIDGADEVDRYFQLIKGGGGALTREKIVANICSGMVVVVDPSKMVETLGAFRLPVEILPFGWQSTLDLLRRTCPGLVSLRRVPGEPDVSLDGQTVSATVEGGPFVTDNGNLIVDCQHGPTIDRPRSLESALLAIPGVVEVGLFTDMCDVVVIGTDDGTEVRLRPEGRLG